MVKKVEPQFINPQGRIINVDNVDTELKQFAHYVFVETDVSNVTITLPKSVGLGGKQIYIKKKSTPNQVLIVPKTGDKIDGILDSINITGLNNTFRLVSDNAGSWECIATVPGAVGPVQPQPLSFGEITDTISDTQIGDQIIDITDFDTQSFFEFFDEFGYPNPVTDLDIIYDHLSSRNPETQLEESTGRPGVIESDAGPNEGDFAYISTQTTCLFKIDITKLPMVARIICSPRNNTGGFGWFAGLVDALPTYPGGGVYNNPLNGVFFRKIEGGNILAVTRSAGVETVTDTGIDPVGPPFACLITFLDISGVLNVRFQLTDISSGTTLFAGQHSTNIPSSSIDLFLLSFIGTRGTVGPTGNFALLETDSFYMGQKR